MPSYHLNNAVKSNPASHMQQQQQRQQLQLRLALMASSDEERAADKQG